LLAEGGYSEAKLGLSKARAVEAIKEFSVLGLYLERRISSGKAAELLGMRKREFIRFLARKRIPSTIRTES